MTKRELGSLAFKLAGIYVLVQALTSLYTTAILFTPDFRKQIGAINLDWGTVLAIGAGPTLALFILAAVLVGFSERLARWTFAESEAVVTTWVAMAELKAVLLAVIGIILIVSALPRFASFAFYFAAPAGSIERTTWGDIRPQLAQISVTLLIGIGLIIAQHGVADGWARVRRIWQVLRGRDEATAGNEED